MNAFGMDSLGQLHDVEVDVYTSAYRISGTVRSPFRRVAEILNQLTGHLSVEHATISEHGGPSTALAAPAALVALDEILLMAAPGLGEGGGATEMRIQKRPVLAQLFMAPIRVTGTIHVPMGSRPVDGLLNVQDRFVPMTDVRIESAAHSHLDRSAAVVAVRRVAAHLVLVADDERPDQLLADVIDERTAEAWLRSGEER